MNSIGFEEPFTQGVYSSTHFTRHFLSDKTDSVAHRVLKAIVAWPCCAVLSGLSALINPPIGAVRIVHALFTELFRSNTDLATAQVARERFKRGCYQIFVGCGDEFLGATFPRAFIFTLYCANETVRNCCQTVARYGVEFSKALVR